MARILIVDDDEKILSLYKEIFSREGFIVLVANNGRDCLEIAEREPLDLILLDVMMPEMDGGSVAESLLEKPRTRNVPLIFLTGIITGTEQRELEKQKSNRTYLSKDSGVEEIIKKVKEALDVKKL